jgi:hypothetical protein
MEFPVKVEKGNNDALEAIRDTDLSLWTQMAKAEMSERSLE